MTTLGYAPLAIGLAVVTAAVLAYKQSLHGLVEFVSGGTTCTQACGC
jgi:uncharacterized membrane protein (DUF4010 family)